ncbi:zf-HC2 domain-containing protein [Cellulosimicrobium terreum]|nr:zf-HC2 domain-containing protein [Cellulosimicrobium terreum]
MTVPPGQDPYREWDAAYVLGALGPGDRRVFEQHLASCDGCREAVAELAGLPGLLAGVDAEEAVALVPADRAGSGDVVPLASLAATTRRRRVRRRGLLAAAAVALVVAGGVTGASVTDRAGTSGTTVELLPVEGTDVHAELVLTSEDWGTRLDWSCSYPAGTGDREATYELVLVDEAGTREVVATWSATDAGRSDGLGASSAIPVEGIARLELGVTGIERPLAAADVTT